MIKAIIIIINRSFKPGMSEDALYEVTRGDWKNINDKKKQADYAVAIANGVIKAVYRIEEWNPAPEDRQRFTGSPADDMKDYINRNVGKKKQGDQDPTYFTDDLEEFVEGGGFKGIQIVEKQHVSDAFDYIRDKGDKEESNNTFSLSEKSKAKSKAVAHEEILYAIKDTIRIAYLYAIKQEPDEQGEFSEDQIEMFGDTMPNDNWQSIAEPRLDKLGFSIVDIDNKKEVIMPKNSGSYLELLSQFKQIILFGPPGTGKTFSAKEIVKEILGIEKDKELPKDSEYWNIVQFHPSYNYEDFVRGVQVKTTEKGQVTYETLNKTFGAMCQVAEEEYEKAEKEKRNPRKYVLIIDEINRANVSAVLGELIYALEYRDEEIKTPYEVDDKQGIIIPSNLYIIGTMNTADRTIGQIDYAVRRRFAFKRCLPEKSVIKDKKAQGYFALVEKIFNKDDDNCISSDFDINDVLIGHSYFMAKRENKDENLTLKILYQILYQVIPILEEYVKDGVLKEAATSRIDGIAKNVEKDIEIEISKKKLLADELEESDLSASGKGGWFYWKYKDDGDKVRPLGVVDTAREVIAHFISMNLHLDINDFQEKFKDLRRGQQHPRIVLLEEGEKENSKTTTKKYFTEPEYRQTLDNGDVIVISREWGATGEQAKPFWEKFKNKMDKHDYFIRQYYIVGIGEDKRREWKYCHEFGFIAAGGGDNPFYHTIMETYKKGDIIFAYLMGKGDRVNKLDKGVICYGEVIDEAKEISKFKVPNNDLLANCVLKDDNGKTYQDKFSAAFIGEYPDKAVGVKWLAEPLDIPYKFNMPRGHFIDFPIAIMRELREAFNLDGKESE